MAFGHALEYCMGPFMNAIGGDGSRVRSRVAVEKYTKGGLMMTLVAIWEQLTLGLMFSVESRAHFLIP